MRGPMGEIRLSYQRAATLGPWELHGAKLSAQLVTVDAFRLSQEPLTFVVPRPHGAAWRWPLQSVQVDGQSLTATVSPEEA